MSVQVGRFAMIPVSKFRENSIALRTEVDREDVAYQELVNAIKTKGFLSVITAREVEDDYFKIVDGLHRYTAACECGLTEIPCLIVTVEEQGVLAAQIMANATRIETKPVQYATAMKQMLQLEPGLTTEELGGRVNKSKSWVEQQLKLTKLTPELQRLVDDRKIGASNAITLSLLPQDKQMDYATEAMTTSPALFGPKVSEIVKELRAAARTQRQPDLGFKPQIIIRKLAEVRPVLDQVKMGNSYVIEDILTKAEATTATAAAEAMLEWFLGLDPVSVQIQQAKWEQRKQETEADKARRKAEREAKKLEEAREALNS